MSAVIKSIDRFGPAWWAGLKVGDKLLSVNGQPVEDVLDYRYYGYDARLELELERGGRVIKKTLRKQEGQEPGIDFEDYLMDRPRACSNRCVFCFVDQLPRGMRRTLYFKDDDARLSFLQGNYITLTNLSDHDIERMIKLRISPINVSVHATDDALHCKMLGNKQASRSLDYMRAFGKAGIVMNGQIVVCPGWNDGEALRQTLSDLMDMNFAACCLVPVGITKYRKGLAKLEPVTKESAGAIIDIAEEFGAKALAERGTRMFFCADSCS